MREVATTGEFGKLALAPPFRQQQAAAFALVALAGAKAVNQLALGYSPAYRALVDGRANTALTQVNTNGGRITFEFEFEKVDAVLEFIAAELPRRSPRQSGDYIRGHILLADGVQIPMHAPFPKAKEFVFINTVPYARKIELGVTESGRPFVIQVPPYVYQVTASQAQHMFPKAKIEYGFQALAAGAAVDWARSPSGRVHARHARRGNPKLHHDWLTRQPVIIVRGY